MFDSVIPSKVKINETGYYACSFVFPFSANPTGNRQVLVKKNGTTTIGTYRTPATQSSSAILNGSFFVKLNAGDYLEFYAKQTSGGAVSIVYDLANGWLNNVSIRKAD
jgi:hypothetical protein